MDYDNEYEDLVRAAKEAEALRGQSGMAEFMPQNRMVGRRFIAPTLGEMFAGGVNRAVGSIGLDRAMGRKKELDAQQQQEFNDLSQQLAQVPGEDSEDPLAMNSRRMDIAQRMSQLPRARAYAQQLINQSAGFPERYAEKRKQAEERAALAEQTKAADAARAADANATRISLGELAAASQAENRNLQRQIAADRQANDRAIAEMRAGQARTEAQARADAAQAKRDAEAQRVQDKRDAANAKRIEWATESANQLDNILSNADQLWARDENGQVIRDPKTGERMVSEDVDRAVGPINATIDSRLMRAGTVAARNNIRALQDQLTMTNLATVKRALGQSVGSMQAQEWDKFLNQIRSLDMSNPTPAMQKNLNFVYDFLGKHRAEVEKVLGGGTAAPVNSAPAGSGTMPPPGARVRKFNPATGRLE